MNPGDIGLVRFPFSDAQGENFIQRPVLILGVSPTGPAEDERVLLAQITGSAHRLANLKRGDLLLSRWQAFGLLRPSAIRCRKLYSCAPHELLQRLGAVDGPTLATVRTEVCLLAGC